MDEPELPHLPVPRFRSQLRPGGRLNSNFGVGASCLRWQAPLEVEPMASWQRPSLSDALADTCHRRCGLTDTHFLSYSLPHREATRSKRCRNVMDGHVKMATLEGQRPSRKGRVTSLRRPIGKSSGAGGFGQVSPKPRFCPALPCGIFRRQLYQRLNREPPSLSRTKAEQSLLTLSRATRGRLHVEILRWHPKAARSASDACGHGASNGRWAGQSQRSVPGKG